MSTERPTGVSFTDESPPHAESLPGQSEAVLHEETGTETALVLRAHTVFIGVHCVLGDVKERLENAHISSSTVGI